MELEQLKTSWKELSEKMEKAEIFNRQVTMNMLHRNAKSSAGKLEKYEMIFFVISVLYSGFLGVALALNENTLIKNESIIVCLVLFILAAIWQGYKLIILQQVRFDSCTTLELLTRVTKYKLLTKGRLIAGMITLIPLFALLIYFQRDMMVKELWIGMITGAVLGLVIGIRTFMNHWKNINELLTDLEEIKSYN